MHEERIIFEMTTERDPTRDVLRGLTALEMAFVNIAAIPWTNHSGYIGQPTYADTIFPCFAFLMGMSPTPARRSIGLIGLGLAVNATSASSKGDRLRIPGVLQRLGVASLILNEPSLSFLQRFYGLPLINIWYAISVLLAGSINYFAHPDYLDADPFHTAQTEIDRLCFGNRIYTHSYDPEGLLGALTTAVSMLVGKFIVSERFTRSQQVLGSLAMISLGELLHILLPRYAPISKSLWTPSFVFVTSGISILRLLLVQTITRYIPKVVKSFLISVGQRSLEMYLLSTVTEIALQHGFERSAWSRTLSALSLYTGRGAADLILSLSFTVLMGFCAVALARSKLKLSW